MPTHASFPPGHLSLAILAIVAVILTACGDERNVSAATPSATRHDSRPSGDLLRITSADTTGRRLVVTYTLPTPCAPGLREAHVTERPDEVVVTLYRRPPRPRDETVFCAQVVTDKKVTVTLDQPLGDRPLVDGSSGRGVQVRGR